MDKNCKYCGVIFTPKRSDGIYCSTECCKKNYYQENKVAAQARVQAWVKENPERYREIQAGYKERQRKIRRESPVTYERTCEGCEEKMIASRKDKRYCSKTCANKVHSRRTKRYARRGENWDEIFTHFWGMQNGKCYLCEDPLDQSAYHVDHDHSCCPPGRSCEKCRRGLACPLCNWIIGYAKDDPDRLQRITNNLETANLLAKERITGRTE